MKTAIVLGGYGLIGSACLRALREAGFRVVGVGRSREAGRRCDPKAEWVAMDLAKAGPAYWAAVLRGADVVVNAAGALQDGARDDLTGIHETAVARLVEALRGSGTRVVQISAAGAREDAATEFMRSKARGDRRLMESGLDWVVLRPALVLGPQAYGGTALLRAAAAVPGLEVRVLADSPVQTVFVEDLARAVAQAARREIAGGMVAEIAEPEVRTLGETIRALRDWQGFAPWRWSVALPRRVLGLVTRGADALGWLGWRSPLRSTAIRTLEEGVTADPSMWIAAGGAPCRPLGETLAAMPATSQERWFARLFLMLPVGVAALALFWTLSGLVGLWRFEAARAVLTERGTAAQAAGVAVAVGSAVDIALGLGVLVRPWARAACRGMALVAAGYLIGGTILAPDLWADPLGPFLKVVPSIALALMVSAMLEER